jgi:effector-binding domain-containing protein
MGQKLVRYFIFFVCSLVILFILVTLILPSTGRVMKETYIQASPKVVLDQLTTLHHYALWYPWLQFDPAQKVTYQTDKKMSWRSEGKRAVDGTYALTGSGGDSALRFQLSYDDTPPITGAYILRASEDGHGTTVIWYMNMRAGWTPWWRFYAAMMNKLTGPMMETGLTNLKILSEQADVFSNIPIKETSISRKYVATLADTVTRGLIYATLNKLLGEVNAYIDQQDLSAVGDPMAQFQELSDHLYRVNAGFYVSRPFTSDNGVQLMVIPSGTVLMADYQGSYAGVQDAYQALSHFADGFTKTASVYPWETYLDGNIPQGDSSYCHIKVYYPVSRK